MTFEEEFGRKIKVKCYTHHIELDTNSREEMHEFYVKHARCQVC